MHTALWQLIWLDLRGSFRALSQIRRSWKQIFLFGMMLLFAVFFLVMRAAGGQQIASARFGDAMPFWALIYLLATWLTAAADRGLVMRPAEIHFIVGGPFPNRDVITLNLVRLGIRAFLSSAILSLVAIAYVQSYLASLLGMWMLMSVSLLVGMIASLSARRVQATWIQMVRRSLTILAGAIVVGLLAQSASLIQEQSDSLKVSTLAAMAGKTAIGSWLLPPLEWMFRPISAASFFPEALMMLPLRMMIVAGLVGCIYALGRDFTEVTTTRTDQSVARRQQALRGGSVSHTGIARRFALPMLPRMAGVGSVAWLQMLHSIRISMPVEREELRRHVKMRWFDDALFR